MRLRRLGWALAASVTLWVALAPLPALGARFLHLLVLGLLPGLLVSGWLWPRWDPTRRTFAALALSPFVLGAPAALTLALAPGRLRTQALPLLLLALACMWQAVRRHGPPPAPVAGEPYLSRTDAGLHTRAVWTAATLWSCTVALLLLGNPVLASRSDGWYHGAVLAQLLQRGGVPEDPYFAGLKLMYFWGWHAWATLWLRTSHQPLAHLYAPLIASNIFAAFAVVLGVGTLTQRLGGRPRAVLLACALGVGGYAPFGWVQIAGRAFTGQVRGWTDIARQLNVGVDSVLGTLASGQLHASLGFFGDKYLVLTPFAMGLALLLLGVLALLELAEQPDTRRGLAFAVVLAATLFIHTVIGEAFALLAAVWWLWRSRAAVVGEWHARQQLLVLALATAAGVALVAPYLFEITSGKHAHLGAGFTPVALYSFFAGGALLVPAAVLWLASRARTKPDAAVLLVLLLACAALALGLKLPENNQSKFLNLLWLLAAAPAALGYQVLARRGLFARVLVLGGLALAALPNVVFALWGFAAEHGQSRSAWLPPDVATAEGMAWAYGHTPVYAEFCELGGGKELLTYAGRSTLWAGVSGERDWGYTPEQMAVRRALVTALVHGQDPVGRAAELLAEEQREVIVMVRSAAPVALGDPAALATRPDRFELLWANKAIAFFRYKPPLKRGAP